MSGTTATVVSSRAAATARTVHVMPRPRPMGRPVRWSWPRISADAVTPTMTARCQGWKRVAELCNVPQSTVGGSETSTPFG